jgi:hypothetical protein
MGVREYISNRFIIESHVWKVLESGKGQRGISTEVMVKTIPII